MAITPRDSGHSASNAVRVAMTHAPAVRPKEGFKRHKERRAQLSSLARPPKSRNIRMRQVLAFAETLWKQYAMAYKRLVALTVAAIMVTAFSVLPVDARAKKKTKYRADTTTLSLDGRNTGRARTCGFDTFLYDGLGVPVGPYCH